MFTGLEHEKKDKVEVPQRNKMLVYNILHLVLLVKMKNIIPNKRYLTVGI